MSILFIDVSSRVIINPYAINNYATRAFTLYYNKAGFAYHAYYRNDNVSNTNICVVKDETGTYLLNYFHKDYCTYENQIPLDDLSLKERLTKFQSLKCLNDSQWTIV